MHSQASTRYLYAAFGPDLRARRPVQLMRRRLLVVEDDEDLWPLLERIGLHVDPDLIVHFASSPDEAIDRMTCRVRYDAILVDDGLPRPGEGRRLEDPIEHLQPWARVAMMSGQSDLGSRRAVFLPKPFSPRDCGEFLFDLLL